MVWDLEKEYWLTVRELAQLEENAPFVKVFRFSRWFFQTKKCSRSKRDIFWAVWKEVEKVLCKFPRCKWKIRRSSSLGRWKSLSVPPIVSGSIPARVVQVGDSIASENVPLLERIHFHHGAGARGAEIGKWIFFLHFYCKAECRFFFSLYGFAIGMCWLEEGRRFVTWKAYTHTHTLTRLGWVARVIGNLPIPLQALDSLCETKAMKQLKRRWCLFVNTHTLLRVCGFPPLGFFTGATIDVINHFYCKYIQWGRSRILARNPLLCYFWHASKIIWIIYSS